MADQPNIIVFFSDQQRWDTCGCYGQQSGVTPQVDRMAEGGVRFANAFTCQPVCGPARACLQTGRWATELGCHTNNRALPLSEPTLARWLAAAGYETGYLGKWHLASDAAHNYRTVATPPERRGGYEYWLAADVLEFTSHPFGGHMFDGAGRQVNFRGYRVTRQTDFVLDYLQSRDLQRPFFLFVSYLEPHHQNDLKRFVGPRGSRQRFAQYEVPGDLAGTGGDWRENYPDYLGCCHSLDTNLGRVRELLAARGLTDNTLLVYTSDHGSHFCTRNSEYKRACHDGCLRIPLVLTGPGFGGGLVREELASLIDVPPTILRAAGVPVPETMGGRALQEAVAGAPDWPEEVFAQISESQVGRCLRTARWKYSVRALQGRGWQDAGADVYTEDFLYDLQADPHERCNLVGEPALAPVREELSERLRQRMVRAGEQAPQILPATAQP